MDKSDMKLARLSVGIKLEKLGPFHGHLECFVLVCQWDFPCQCHFPQWIVIVPNILDRVLHRNDPHSFMEELLK